MLEEVYASYQTKEKKVFLDEISNNKNCNVLELPKTFFLSDKGFYSFSDKVWNIDKEGLYEFYDGSGAKERHYYFEDDAVSLVSLILSLNEFSASTNNNRYFVNVDKLVSENQSDTTNFALLASTCMALSIPFRHIPIYSIPLDITLFDWIEIWDKKSENWLLFWLDRNIYLGEANSTRTCFDVFDELAENIDKYDIFYRPEDVSEEYSSETDKLRALKKVSADFNEVLAFLKETEAFPAIRPDGYYILNAYTREEYGKQANQDNEIDIKIEGQRSSSYKLCFVNKRYVLENIYDKQIFVMPGKYAFVG